MLLWLLAPPLDTRHQITSVGWALTRFESAYYYWVYYRYYLNWIAGSGIPMWRCCRGSSSWLELRRADDAGSGLMLLSVVDSPRWFRFRKSWRNSDWNRWSGRMPWNCSSISTTSCIRWWRTRRAAFKKLQRRPEHPPLRTRIGSVPVVPVPVPAPIALTTAPTRKMNRPQSSKKWIRVSFFSLSLSLSLSSIYQNDVPRLFRPDCVIFRSLRYIWCDHHRFSLLDFLSNCQSRMSIQVERITGDFSNGFVSSAGRCGSSQRRREQRSQQRAGSVEGSAEGIPQEPAGHLPAGPVLRTHPLRVAV